MSRQKHFQAASIQRRVGTSSSLHQQELTAVTSNTQYPQGLYLNQAWKINQDDKHFKEWFIGFTEAEASFIISTRGDLQFVITQGYRNLSVLYYIKMRLHNLGRVLKQGTQTFRFVLQDREGLEYIINIVNGLFVLNNSRLKLERFIQAFNHKYKADLVFNTSPSTLPTLKDSWLAGFTDGDGCFNISYVLTKRKFLVRFLVSQQEDLSALRGALFKLGAIEYNRSNQNFSYTIADWSTSKQRPLNIDQVIHYFQRNMLLTSKANSFAIWFYIQNQLFYSKMTPEKEANLKSLCKLINDAPLVNEGPGDHHSQESL